MSGVLVGRGVLRNPWILAQADDIARGPRRRATVSLAERGQFLLDYIDLLLSDGVEEAEGFRHVASLDARRRRRPPAGASGGSSTSSAR